MPAEMQCRQGYCSHPVRLKFCIDKEREGIYCNAQMSSKMLREMCKIDTAGQNLLKTAMDRLGLSARAYDRILKVSRTIADLDGTDDIKNEHLAEAIQYRSLDRENWAG